MSEENKSDDAKAASESGQASSEAAEGRDAQDSIEKLEKALRAERERVAALKREAAAKQGVEQKLEALEQELLALRREKAVADAVASAAAKAADGGKYTLDVSALKRFADKITVDEPEEIAGIIEDLAAALRRPAVGKVPTAVKTSAERSDEEGVEAQITKADFEAMSFKDRYFLSKKNPELYAKLSNQKG